MKLNDQLITSLDCLHVNFSFVEAWNKISILIRDLSPDRIHYGIEEKKLIYDALCKPSESRLEGASIVFSNGKRQELSLSPEIMKSLNSLETDEDRIRIIALSLLADRNLSTFDLSKISKPDTSEESAVILQYGVELRLTPIKPGGSHLTVKRIYVPGTGKHRSKIGKLELEPGDVTFGVFQDGNLVDVSPNKISNDTYDLRYVMEDNDVKLEVCNLDNEKLKTHQGVTYISLLGNNDFVMVRNRCIYCNKSESLNTRLRNNVSMVRNPLIIRVEDKLLHIIYEDTTEITIDI